MHHSEIPTKEKLNKMAVTLCEINYGADNYGRTWKSKVEGQTVDEVVNTIYPLFSKLLSDRKDLLKIKSIIDGTFWTEQMGR